MRCTDARIPDWLEPYQPTLARFIGNDQMAEVLDRWTEPHRKFHSLGHLKDVIECFPPERTALVITAFYHDVVYEPGRRDNELRSADLLRTHALVDSKGIIASAVQIILSTADLRHKDAPDEEAFFRADCQVLLRDWEDLLVYEEQIRAEFQSIPECEYLVGRSAFLEDASTIFPENRELLLRLRDHIQANDALVDCSM